MKDEERSEEKGKLRRRRRMMREGKLLINRMRRRC
jgi:hypothetical protein